MKNFLKEERKLWQKGYKYVVGVDEAGRGPLAGPVVAAALVIDPVLAAALIINPKSKIQNLLKKIKEIKDSKKLSAQKREKIYQILTHSSQIKWAIGRVSEKIIDKINILEAAKLAMTKAIKKLKIKPDFVILDGNFGLKFKTKNPEVKKINQKLKLPSWKINSIIKADEKVLSCLLASILAKVSRDKIMEKYHRKFPVYRFDKHKGYPTKFHLEMLKKYGICKIHRKTFKPIIKV